MSLRKFWPDFRPTIESAAVTLAPFGHLRQVSLNLWLQVYLHLQSQCWQLNWTNLDSLTCVGFGSGNTAFGTAQAKGCYFLLLLFATDSWGYPCKPPFSVVWFARGCWKYSQVFFHLMTSNESLCIGTQSTYSNYIQCFHLILIELIANR